MVLDLIRKKIKKEHEEAAKPAVTYDVEPPPKPRDEDMTKMFVAFHFLLPSGQHGFADAIVDYHPAQYQGRESLPKLLEHLKKGVMMQLDARGLKNAIVAIINFK